MVNQHQPPNHRSGLAGDLATPNDRTLPAHVALDADAHLSRAHWLIIADHRVGGVPVLPGALFVQLASQAARSHLEGADGPVVLRDVSFEEPVFFDADRPPRVEVLHDATDASSNGGYFAIRANGRVVTTGYVATMASPATDASSPATPDPNQFVDQFADRPMATSASVYRALAEHGNTYGQRFQRLIQLSRHDLFAMGDIRACDDEENALAPTLLLDAAVQLLAVSAGEPAGMFVLERIAHAHIAPLVDCCAALVERTDDDNNGRIVGRVWLLDGDKRPLAKLDGVCVRLRGEAAAPETLAIAATFTAEPIADGLELWMDKLDRPAQPVFAPFNQVFQELLSPDSLLARNRHGANILLLRLEDWLGGRDRLPLRISAPAREQLLADQKRTTLPNQLEIAHLNDYETEHLYREIFIDRVYGKRGIFLPDDACIIDVGANIGMFSMWVQRECERPRVYAIEPAPAAFAALSANLEMYTQGVTPLACGLSDRDGEAEFTYYEHSSVFSGFKADTQVDGRAIRAIVENVLQAPALPSSDASEIDQDIVDDLLAERTAATKLTRPIKRLSSLIREYSLDRIDLLKIDAEKSELDILAGIDDRDWAKIQQLVLEIHDADGSLLTQVRELLTSKGFATVDIEEDVFQGSGFRNLYARRETAAAATEAQSPTAHAQLRLKRTIDEFVTALNALMTRSNVPCVVAICPPSPRTDHHAAILRAGELRLSGALHDRLGRSAPTQLRIISSSELLDAVGADGAHDRETERLGAIPYTPLLYAELATRTARWLRARSLSPKKLIVLDCDQTLWRGVCGEDGPLGVQITPPYAHLQRFSRAQREHGMLLALCSKNREADVQAVFADNPGMVLTWQDISAHAINWQPKSQNIHTLVTDLSLGLDSVVVLDDNPVECAEITANCPGVIALPVPTDGSQIPAFIDNLWAFDRLAITDEDRVRADRYQQERQRKEFRQTTSSFAEFLSSLELDVRIEEPQPQNLPRMAQLTQRTNQFNLTTVRRTESDVAAFLERATTHARVISVSDRFGDYGLVGLLLCDTTPDALQVDTFLLSCRVLGRGVEHHLLSALGQLARTLNLSSVTLTYRETARNEPARRFLDSIDTSDGRTLTTSDGSERIYAFPADEAASIEFVPRERADEDSAQVNAKKAPADARPGGSDSGRDSNLKSESAREAERLLEITELLSRPGAVLRAIDSRRRRLRPALSSSYAAPTSDLERAVTSAWQEVLGLEQVGVGDNFFELGGTSLKAVQLIAKLRRTVAPSMTIVNLFEHPTVSKLARMLAPGSESDNRQRMNDSASRGAKRKARKRARRKKSGSRKSGGSSGDES